MADTWNGTSMPPSGRGPYTINSAAEFAGFRDWINGIGSPPANARTATYRLMTDIDLNYRQWTPIGKDAANAFSGTFDANGKTVSNLIIESSSYAYVGLFGYLNGKLSNLKLKDIVIYVNQTNDTIIYAGMLAGSVTNGSIANVNAAGRVTVSSSAGDFFCAGGLIGILQGTTSITDSFATGSINASSSSFCDLGGLVGRQAGGSGGITYSYAMVNINASSSSFSGGIYAGGLVGRQEAGSGSITYSYATGNVNASSSKPAASVYAGGLVGIQHNAGKAGDITYSYATGNVNASSLGSVYAGGLVGSQGYANIINSYATGNINASSPYAIAGGLVGSQNGLLGTFASTLTSCVFDAQGTGLTNGVGRVHNDLGVTARTNAEMTGNRVPAGLGELGSWIAISRYYPQNPNLTALFPKASAFSAVPVRFSNGTDTSKGVTAEFRVPKNTPAGDAVTLTCDPIDALTIASSGSDWLLTPAASADVVLTASANIGGTTMTKDFSLRILYEPKYEIALSVTGTHTFPNAVVGYGPQTPLGVIVTNTEEQPTGTLVALLSDDEADAFVCSPNILNSIAVRDEYPFTVVPNTGLDAGTYTAAVTVSGAHGIMESFAVSFTVEPEPEPNYDIDLSVEGTHTFPSAVVGYGPETPDVIATNIRDQSAGALSVPLSGTNVPDPSAVVGYAPPTPLCVIVANTRNQPTGTLSILLLGPNSSDFKLSASSLDSIAAGGEDSFTVAPNTGLDAGTYTAAVTISGEHGITESFGVSFTVNPEPEPGYGIALSVTEPQIFPAAVVGYGSQTPVGVTVTNTGDQPTETLFVLLLGEDANAFVCSPNDLDSIAAGDEYSFTIAPNTGLDAGTYTAAVMVSGEHELTASFAVSFTVEPRDESGGGGGCVSSEFGGLTLALLALFLPKKLKKKD
ncbi:MAG: hypothetical protein LBQ42_02595 [Synergistaceae bacterium]|nr:hypothetical protein [Synergistaceae bacterium]